MINHFFLLTSVALIFIIPTAKLQAEEEVCPSYETLAENILDKITPSFNAVTAPALFRQFKSKQVDGGYQTKLGIVIDSSCFLAKNAKDKQIEEKKFEETLQKILENAKRCGQKRLMSSTLQLFYGAINKSPRVSCDSKGCGSNAAACANVTNNSITIKKFSDSDKSADSRFDESLWFHELLHLAKIDNQGVDDHNHNDESNGTTDQDEVYYWQRTCFSPDTIVRKVRYESEKCQDKNISIDNCKLDSCLMPFQINKSSYGRFSYNKKEVELSCLFYKSYLKKEYRLQQSIDSILVPELLTCEKNEKGTKTNCPNFSDLTNKATESKALSRFLPPTKLTPKDLKVWTEETCATFSSMSKMSEDISGCAYRLSSDLTKRDGEWPTSIKELIKQKIVSEEEIEKLSTYWNNVSAKGHFVTGGPQKYSDFPGLKEKSALKEQLAQSIKTCQTDFNYSKKDIISSGLKGSELCRKYELFIQQQEAALLKEWE